MDNYVLYNSLSPFCVLFYEFSSWSDDSDEPQVTSQKWERPPFSMFGPTMFYTQCLDLISHRNMGLWFNVIVENPYVRWKVTHPQSRKLQHVKEPHEKRHWIAECNWRNDQMAVLKDGNIILEFDIISGLIQTVCDLPYLISEKGICQCWTRSWDLSRSGWVQVTRRGKHVRFPAKQILEIWIRLVYLNKITPI